MLVAELPTSYMISVDVFHDGGQCPSFVLFCSVRTTRKIYKVATVYMIS